MASRRRRQQQQAGDDSETGSSKSVDSNDDSSVASDSGESDGDTSPRENELSNRDNTTTHELIHSNAAHRTTETENNTVKAKKNNFEKIAKVSLDPAMAPRGQFFLHDDRLKQSSGKRKPQKSRFKNDNVESGRNFRGPPPNAPARPLSATHDLGFNNNGPSTNPGFTKKVLVKQPVEDVWKHDKFEELNKQNQHPARKADSARSNHRNPQSSSTSGTATTSNQPSRSDTSKSKQGQNVALRNVGSPAKQLYQAPIKYSTPRENNDLTQSTLPSERQTTTPASSTNSTTEPRQELITNVPVGAISKSSEKVPVVNQKAVRKVDSNRSFGSMNSLDSKSRALYVDRTCHTPSSTVSENTLLSPAAKEFRPTPGSQMEPAGDVLNISATQLSYTQNSSTHYGLGGGYSSAQQQYLNREAAEVGGGIDGVAATGFRNSIGEYSIHSAHDMQNMMHYGSEMEILQMQMQMAALSGADHINLGQMPVDMAYLQSSYGMYGPVDGSYAPYGISTIAGGGTTWYPDTSVMNSMGGNSYATAGANDPTAASPITYYPNGSYYGSNVPTSNSGSSSIAYHNSMP